MLRHETLLPTGIVIDLKHATASHTSIGILAAEEGSYENNQWVPLRHLNGDQARQGRHIRIPAEEWGIQKFKLYEYQ